MQADRNQDPIAGNEIVELAKPGANFQQEDQNSSMR